MFSATHFRTEFVRQSEATIGGLVVAHGLLGLPYWLAPLPLVGGYVAGASHHGEILIRRLLAGLLVGGRALLGRPRTVNVQTAWDSWRAGAEGSFFRE